MKPFPRLERLVRQVTIMLLAALAALGLGLICFFVFDSWVQLVAVWLVATGIVMGGFGLWARRRAKRILAQLNKAIVSDDLGP